PRRAQPHADIAADDKLAASDAGVSRGSTVDEAAGRVHEQRQLVVPPLTERAGAELLAHVLGDLLLVGFGAVLSGDDDRGDVARVVAVVVERDLRLAVRTQPRVLAGVAIVSHRL